MLQEGEKFFLRVIIISHAECMILINNIKNYPSIRHGFMFWADFNESKIWQSNIDGSGKNLVVNTALSGQDPGKKHNYTV